MDNTTMERNIASTSEHTPRFRRVCWIQLPGEVTTDALCSAWTPVGGGGETIQGPELLIPENPASHRPGDGVKPGVEGGAAVFAVLETGKTLRAVDPVLSGARITFLPPMMTLVFSLDRDIAASGFDDEGLSTRVQAYASERKFVFWFMLGVRCPLTEQSGVILRPCYTVISKRCRRSHSTFHTEITITSVCRQWLRRYPVCCFRKMKTLVEISEFGGLYVAVRRICLKKRNHQLLFVAYCCASCSYKPMESHRFSISSLCWLQWSAMLLWKSQRRQSCVVTVFVWDLGLVLTSQ